MFTWSFMAGCAVCFVGGFVALGAIKVMIRVPRTDRINFGFAAMAMALGSALIPSQFVSLVDQQSKTQLMQCAAVLSLAFLVLTIAFMLYIYRTFRVDPKVGRKDFGLAWIGKYLPVFFWWIFFVTAFVLWCIGCGWLTYILVSNIFDPAGIP